MPVGRDAGLEPELENVPNGLAGYEAVVARAYFPMRFSRLDRNRRFRARTAGVRIGPTLLTRLYADGAYRGEVDARRSDGAAPFVLNLAEVGGCHFQGIRDASTRPGDLILLDANRPFEVSQSGAGQSLALLLPAAVLGTHCVRPGDLALRPIPTASGLAAVLRETLLGCWRQRQCLDPGSAGELLGAIAQLVSAAFREVATESSGGTPASGLHFLRIRDLVQRHLANPDLDAAFVADRLGMSKSNVFAVMQRAGTTLGRVLLEARLERARRMLDFPAGAERSIARVGYAVGFREPAHFTRRFSGRYGMTPSAYRARARHAMGADE